MDWGFLSFLAKPWFVVPWYIAGILGAAIVIYDEVKYNTVLKKAMKWAWPIIVLFFSVIGFFLYFATARAPDIGKKKGEEAKKAHDVHERNMFRRVNGAVIHCVAGDGLGIMTGMVIARAAGMSFWQEFWFEYLVGFLFGWFIFQFKSMMMMTDSKVMALAMAFRAEFFSMLTVMAGMGAVMTYVTPLAVTAQPKPLTFAFWGFGMLGLLVGFVLTYPMNWMMVKIGWKHGMGGKETVQPVQAKTSRFALVTTMCVLGIAALVLPAWLTEAREGVPVERQSGVAAAQQAGVEPTPTITALAQGVRDTLTTALIDMDGNRHTEAMRAIDALRLAAGIGRASAPDSALRDVDERVKKARHELHNGNQTAARGELMAAHRLLSTQVQQAGTSPLNLRRFTGAKVVNANGVMIGKVAGIRGNKLLLELGGVQDVWGFWDLSTGQSITVTRYKIVFGPSQSIGRSLVALPTRETPPLSQAALRLAESGSRNDSVRNPNP